MANYNFSCESVNVEKVPNIILNGYMECPICLEFAVSPIYSCTGGHIICGICQAKTDIKKCPTCRADNLSVNAVLERILKSEDVIIPCRYAHHGCTLKIKPCDMQVHLDKECDFRPVKCIERGAGCKGESYTPQELLKHLIAVHKINKRDCFPSLELPHANISNVIGTFCVKRTVSKALFNKINIDPTANHAWNTSYFELDDRTFFLHCRLKCKTVHLWVTLLGEESDAQLYNYTATVSSSRSKSKNKTIQFQEIPIHTVQYSDFDKVEALGHTVSISCDILKLLHDKDPIHPETMFRWDTKFEIYKVHQSL